MPLAIGHADAPGGLFQARARAAFQIERQGQAFAFVHGNLVALEQLRQLRLHANLHHRVFHARQMNRYRRRAAKKVGVQRERALLCRAQMLVNTLGQLGQFIALEVVR